MVSKLKCCYLTGTCPLGLWNRVHENRLPLPSSSALWQLLKGQGKTELRGGIHSVSFEPVVRDDCDRIPYAIMKSGIRLVESDEEPVDGR